jgi:hypothetical protein
MSSVWLEVWPGIRIGNAWYLCSSGNFVILGLYGGQSVIQHRWPKVIVIHLFTIPSCLT